MKKRVLFSATAILVFLTSGAQVPAYVPQSGLKGYWLFSGNANDESGNGYNGTVSNATLTADRFSNGASAYHFNGTGSITTSYQGVLGSNPRAVSFWARTGSTNVMSAVSWGQIATAARYECGFNYGAPGPHVDGGNGVITYSAPVSASNNQWHHYVMQFDTSSVLSHVQVYQDAVLLTTTSNVYSGSNVLNTVAGINVLFGHLGAWPYNGFIGDLDDIGIWDRSLTICEINQLYLASKLTGTLMASSPCPGASATVFAGGMPGPYTFSWTPSGGTGSIAANFSGGNYSVTVSTTKSCTSTFTLNVQNAPVIGVTGPATLCPGVQATLVATGANNYSWMPSGSGSFIVISPQTTASYTVTGVSAAGCIGSAVYTQTVVSLQPLAITGPSTACQGANVTLNASGASSYTWLPGSLFTSSASYSPQAPLTITLQAASVCDSSFRMTTYSIGVLASPTISVNSSNSEPCPGQPVILTAQGATGYTWFPSQSNAVTLSLTPQSTTTVGLTGGLSNGCTASKVFTVNVKICTGLDDVYNRPISVRPNPVTNYIEIESERPVKDVAVYTLDGRLLRQLNPAANRIDLSQVAPGIYFLRIEEEGSPVLIKFIKTD